MHVNFPLNVFYSCILITSFFLSLSLPETMETEADLVNPHRYHPTKKPPTSDSDTNNNNILLAILIPLVLIILIMGTVCLCLRCHGNYNETNNSSSLRHIQHVAVPTHNKDFPTATYAMPPPSLSAYHTTTIAPPGSSSMSGGSTCRITSSVPPMRHWFGVGKI